MFKKSNVQMMQSMLR